MEVIAMQRDRFDEVVAVLCAAFRDYPVMRYVLKDAGDAYGERLPILIGYFTESRFARGYPVLGIEDPETGRLVAAANVNPPHAVPAPSSLERRLEEVGRALGDAAMARFSDFANTGTPGIPAEPHYHLGMIGVLPDRQDDGFGRGMLEAVHAMSAEDPGSDGVSLTTETPVNVGLYEHFGYRVLEHATTRDGELETWKLFRPNSAAG
jgi:GNAT superfamily N-acetyltransferase